MTETNGDVQVRYGLLIGVILLALAFIVACTALLDWHLHDSKVTVDEKSIELEGEPAECDKEVERCPDGEPPPLR